MRELNELGISRRQACRGSKAVAVVYWSAYKSPKSPVCVRREYVTLFKCCESNRVEYTHPPVSMRFLRHYYRHFTETLFVICLSLATTIE